MPVITVEGPPKRGTKERISKTTYRCIKESIWISRGFCPYYCSNKGKSPREYWFKWNVVIRDEEILKDFISLVSKHN